MFLARRTAIRTSVRSAKSSTSRRKLFFESLEDRRVLAIDVAVVSDLVDTSGYTALVNQLNDDTYFDFSATLVNPADIATAGQLSAYDVVVMGGSGFTTLGGYDTFAAALQTWVEGGGGVVMTGWGIFANISSSVATTSQLNAILPVVLDNSYDFQGSPPFTITPNATVHPVTAGVTPFSDGSNDIEFPPAGFEGSSIILADETTTATSVVAVRQPLSGRSVYLGELYTAVVGHYNNTGLRSGMADRLLEQAVAWASNPVAGTLTASIDGGGNLVITDTDAVGKDNHLTISVSGLNVVVTDTVEQFQSAPPGGVLSNGNRTLTIPLAAISGDVVFNTMGGNDLLTVDSSMAASGKPITYNGGDPTSGPPGDALVLSGPGTFGTITHTFVSAADGSVNIAGYLVTYTGLEPVTDNLSATDRIFTFTGGAETVTLADSGAAGDTVSTISSTLGESVAFINPTGSLTINLTSGADVLNFGSLDSQEAGPAPFSANLVINGDGGDTVNFPLATINLGGGLANIGTTGGQPIESINFTVGGLLTTSNVLLTATGAMTTSSPALDVAAGSLVAVAATGIDLDTQIVTIVGTITGAGNIQIDEVDGLSDLLLNAGGGNVTLNAGGPIADTSADGNDILGTNLLLNSVGGIGVSGNPIEVAVVNADISNSTAGGIFVTDTAGGLTLLDLNASGTSVSGVGGNGVIAALSPLTVAAHATTSGGMTYTAGDSAGAGDNLTINAAVTVSDSTASLAFNAGDDFILNNTASISAATTAAINIDAGNADAGTGGTANIFGALAAPGGAAMSGNGDNDTFNVTGPTATALDGITAAVTVNGLGGVNNLNLNDSLDVSGDTATVTHATVEGLGGSPGVDYTYSNVANLDVTATSTGDTLTTSLGGPVASPTSFNGLVSVAVRGNGGTDNMFLHVADSLTNASLDVVNLFGDAGGDNFGGAAAADHIRPVLATGQTQIIINGDANAKTTGPVNPGTDPVLTGPDHLFLDLTTTDSGAVVNPVVIVDTNGGYGDAANTVSFRYNGIEDIDLYDGGVLTNTAIGDFYLRATDNADYIQFVSAAQVNPVFRIRIGNTYYPTSGGNYGPYTTGLSKIFVYGRGGVDTINMYNTRLNAAFFGEAGDDIITGGYGNDLLVGGDGNDRLNGAAVGGNDEIWGDNFNPATDNPAVASQATGGNDQVNTFGGNDTIYGQGGNDIINTGAGDDYINGGLGDDQLDGQSGNDRIYGGAGIDTANGAEGNDVVAGNDGNDALYGRIGNDILIGGLGLDIVNGNEGGDAVVGNESNGSGSGSLAKGDAADAALLALMAVWGPAPTLASLGSFGSAGDDGSVDTLWGGADADAFFGNPTDNAADRNAPGYGLDLN